MLYPNASGKATENLCVWAKGIRCSMGAAGRKAEELQRQPVLMVGRDFVREKSPGSPSRSWPGGAFRAHGVCAATTAPAARAAGEGPCPTPRRPLSVTWFLGLPTREAGLWCQGDLWTPPGGPSLPWGPGAAFQKLILSLLLFQKLPRFFLLFFPPRLLHSFSLSFPVGCHHSLVNEKLGNLPEGQGETGWLRRKERKQTLPPVGTGR